MTKLQQESGASLFTGCLPMLLQLPFFMVMYRLFTTPAVGGEPNSLLGATLFGTPLGAHGLAGSPLVFVVAAGLAVVAWFSVRWQDRHRDTTAQVPCRRRPGSTCSRRRRGRRSNERCYDAARERRQLSTASSTSTSATVSGGPVWWLR
jgi:hypothetical protein